MDICRHCGIEFDVDEARSKYNCEISHAGYIYEIDYDEDFDGDKVCPNCLNAYMELDDFDTRTPIGVDEDYEPAPWDEDD